MRDQEPKVKKNFKLPMFVTALFLANLSIYTTTYFQNIVLIDVAKTFRVSVGTMSQLATVSYLTGLIIGLILGFLAVRFKPKSLLLLGITSYGAGTLVYYFAANFAIVLFSPVFEGIGSGMVDTMIFTLIGEVLPLQKRGWAIGLVVSSQFFTNLVMSPVTSIIAPVAGWRAVLLWFILPISMVSLLVCFLTIPSKPHQDQFFAKPEYVKVFKRILTNKSAIACIIGAVLIGINSSLVVYAVTFFRIEFSVSLSTGAAFGLMASASGFFGGLVAARLINRAGRWLLAISAALLAGILHIFFTFVPYVSGSLAFWLAATFFVGVNAASFTSLILEQVPVFRGTMMSLNQSFRSLGLILGISLSGLVLNLYSDNFHIVMVIFGVAAVAAAAVLFLFAKDPTKTENLQIP
ncbi:MAG: MFS transporter [Candidatus Bathyarchaeia archaeon]|jgi:predicted MFS family arabinose efflux permease